MLNVGVLWTACVKCRCVVDSLCQMSVCCGRPVSNVGVLWTACGYLRFRECFPHTDKSSEAGISKISDYWQWQEARGRLMPCIGFQLVSSAAGGRWRDGGGSR